MKQFRWLLLAGLPMLFGACMSKKQVQALQDQHRQETSRMSERISGLSARVDEQAAEAEIRNRQIAALKQDTAVKALIIA
ncbi:MAG: hypothetical protein ACOVSS_06710, partial [Bacteroidia bacterium]